MGCHESDCRELQAPRQKLAEQDTSVGVRQYRDMGLQLLGYLLKGQLLCQLFALGLSLPLQDDRPVGDLGDRDR